jgi:hypothetical protein
LFIQPSGQLTGALVAAFASFSEVSAPVEVMANVIHTFSLILPMRASAALPTSWDYLNTVG